MTRVLVFPADDQRSGRRLVWPAEALQAQGADVTIANRHDKDDHQDPVWNADYDVVVLQRPMLRRYVEGGDFEAVGAIQRLQADGMRVVVDIDDDFMALNRRNAVWERTHPSTSPDCNWQHLSTACRLADLVTVTTPALARRYGAHGRVRVIPNHIPASYLSIQRPVNEVPVVGWTGAVATHPDDLQVTRGAVSRALQATGAQFYMVGPPDGVQANLGLSEPVVASGFVDLDTYPLEMAKLDVGIVPLELTAFNQAKSWLKMMEMTALGVPCVGSPTAPNIEFATRYRLPLAAKPREWERWITRLVTDEPLRREMSEAGREYMAEETVGANCHMWFDAWESARARGRKAETV